MRIQIWVVAKLVVDLHSQWLGIRQADSERFESVLSTNNAGIVQLVENTSLVWMKHQFESGYLLQICSFRSKVEDICFVIRKCWFDSGKEL